MTDKEDSKRDKFYDKHVINNTYRVIETEMDGDYECFVDATSGKIVNRRKVVER